MIVAEKFHPRAPHTPRHPGTCFKLASFRSAGLFAPCRPTKRPRKEAATFYFSSFPGLTRPGQGSWLVNAAGSVFCCNPGQGIPPDSTFSANSAEIPQSLSWAWFACAWLRLFSAYLPAVWDQHQHCFVLRLVRYRSNIPKAARCYLAVKSCTSVRCSCFFHLCP